MDAARLDDVSFCEVGLEQCSVGALPKRFRAHRLESDIDRICVSPRLNEQSAEGLIRVEQTLTKAFSFEDDPVVVPARKQVDGACAPCRESQILDKG